MPLCNQNLHEIPVAGGYCSTCATCQFCKRQLTVLEYNWCISVAAKYETSIEFKHPGCAAQARQFDATLESVTIPKAHFDYLNACRLLFEPIPELNPKTNEIDAQIKVRQLFHELSLEDQFLATKRMESAASEMSLALSKNRRELEVKFSERDQEKFREARRKREEVTKTGLAPNTVARTEKKVRTKEDKALDSLMHLGLSRAEALASLEESRLKAAARRGETIQ